MDFVIPNQINNLGKEVDSEVKVIKTRRGRKKADTKMFPTINEEGTNGI